MNSNEVSEDSKSAEVSWSWEDVPIKTRQNSSSQSLECKSNEFEIEADPKSVALKKQKAEQIRKKERALIEKRRARWSPVKPVVDSRIKAAKRKNVQKSEAFREFRGLNGINNGSNSNIGNSKLKGNGIYNGINDSNSNSVEVSLKSPLSSSHHQIRYDLSNPRTAKFLNFDNVPIPIQSHGYYDGKYRNIDDFKWGPDAFQNVIMTKELNIKQIKVKKIRDSVKNIILNRREKYQVNYINKQKRKRNVKRNIDLKKFLAKKKEKKKKFKNLTNLTNFDVNINIKDIKTGKISTINTKIPVENTYYQTLKVDDPINFQPFKLSPKTPERTKLTSKVRSRMIQIQQKSQKISKERRQMFKVGTKQANKRTSFARKRYKTISNEFREFRQEKLSKTPEKVRKTTTIQLYLPEKPPSLIFDNDNDNDEKKYNTKMDDPITVKYIDYNTVKDYNCEPVINIEMIRKKQIKVQQIRQNISNIIKKQRLKKQLNFGYSYQAQIQIAKFQSMKKSREFRVQRMKMKNFKKSSKLKVEIYCKKLSKPEIFIHDLQLNKIKEDDPLPSIYARLLAKITPSRLEFRQQRAMRIRMSNEKIITQRRKMYQINKNMSKYEHQVIQQRRKNDIDTDKFRHYRFTKRSQISKLKYDKLFVTVLSKKQNEDTVNEVRYQHSYNPDSGIFKEDDPLPTQNIKNLVIHGFGLDHKKDEQEMKTDPQKILKAAEIRATINKVIEKRRLKYGVIISKKPTCSPKESTNYLKCVQNAKQKYLEKSNKFRMFRENRRNFNKKNEKEEHEEKSEEKSDFVQKSTSTTTTKTLKVDIFIKDKNTGKMLNFSFNHQLVTKSVDTRVITGTKLSFNELIEQVIKQEPENIFGSVSKPSVEQKKRHDKMREENKKLIRKLRTKYQVSIPSPTPKKWNENRYDYNQKQSAFFRLHRRQQLKKIRTKEFFILKNLLRVEIFFLEPDGADHQVRYFHDLPKGPMFDEMPVSSSTSKKMISDDSAEFKIDEKLLEENKQKVLNIRKQVQKLIEERRKKFNVSKIGDIDIKKQRKKWKQQSRRESQQFARFRKLKTPKTPDTIKRKRRQLIVDIAVKGPIDTQTHYLQFTHSLEKSKKNLFK